MRYVFAVLALVTISLYSCSKSGSAEAIQQSRKPLLTNGSWKSIALLSQQEVMGSIVETDLLELADDCDKDNFVTFNEAGTITINEGTIICPNQQQITTGGSWSFLDNEKRLKITRPSDGSTYISTIVELTTTRLRLRTTSGSSGATTTITALYAKM